MKKETISYQETGFFKKLVLDYINDEPKIKRFYTYKPQSDSFKSIIEDKSREKIDRETLVTVLKEQYNDSKKSVFVEQNIESLLEENTFTITTGHQLNIFTGPLYFIYKIIAAINAAKDAEKANPGIKVVPIYWMASEDHDFEEINHLDIHGKKFTWHNDTNGATGRINPSSLKKLLTEIRIELGEEGLSIALFKVFENAYLTNSTLANATRAFVNELFGTYGLIVVDADDKRLKAIFSTIISTDISEQHSFKFTTSQIAELQKEGYTAQVNPREINYFYLDANLRERIIEKDGFFEVLNTDLKFSKAELLEELKNNPEKFSPNVITRPLYQEKILPNLAYVGGGAELAYWMELKPMFDHYQVNFPMIILRPSALFISKAEQASLHKLEFTKDELFMSAHELLEMYVQDKSENTLNLISEAQAIHQVISGMEGKVNTIEKTLITTLKALENRILKSIDHFEHKLLKAEKRKYAIEHAQIKKIKETLFPKGSLQERSVNILSLPINYVDFIKNLVEQIDWAEMEFSLVWE